MKVNNQHNLELFQGIMDFFSFGKIKNFEQLSGGVANYNYLIILETSEEYVVKILGHQTLVTLQNDRAIQKQLKQADIPTISYLENSKCEYIYNRNKIVAVVSKKVEEIIVFI